MREFRTSGSVGAPAVQAPGRPDVRQAKPGGVGSHVKDYLTESF